MFGRDFRSNLQGELMGERSQRSRLVRNLFLAAIAALFSASNAIAEENSYFRTVTIEQGTKAESINCFGCSVIVKGDLDGEVVTIGGNVTIFGRVRKDIVAVGGRIQLKNGAQVDADVVAIGGMVTTEGTVIAPEPRAFDSRPWMHLPGQLSIGWRGVLALLGFHVICVLMPILTLRPRRIQNVVVASRRWLVTSLVGIAAIFVISFGLNWLDESLHVGDVTELVVTVLFLAVLAVGIAGITFAIGDRFFPGRLVQALLAGVILLAVLELIPYLGFVVMVLGACWATGSALWSGLGFRGPQPPKFKKAVTTELKLS
jgi:hypothetical protein